MNRKRYGQCRTCGMRGQIFLSDNCHGCAVEWSGTDDGLRKNIENRKWFHERRLSGKKGVVSNITGKNYGGRAKVLTMRDVIKCRHCDWSGPLSEISKHRKEAHE